MVIVFSFEIAMLHELVGLAVICISIYRVIDIGVPDFLFQKMDGTACSTMRFESPWVTAVEVDRYIQTNIFGINFNAFYEIQYSNIDILRRNVDYDLYNGVTGVLILGKSRRTRNLHLEILSHFVCFNNMPGRSTPMFVVLAFHVCDKANIDTRRPALFILNIIGKIANEISEFGNIVIKDKWIRRNINLQNCEVDPIVCIEVGLINPLTKLSEIPHFKKIIIVAGLDECKFYHHEHHDSPYSIDTLLENTIRRFPSWLKFVLISRYKKIIKESFSLLHREDFDDNARTQLLPHVKRTLETDKNGNIYTIFIGILIILSTLGIFIMMIETIQSAAQNEQAELSFRLRDFWRGYIRRTLFTESFRGNISEIRYFLYQRHVSVNSFHPEIGLTPLHLAAVNGQFQACKFLLDEGANSKALSKSSCYPYLHDFMDNASNFYFHDSKDATALRLAILFKHSYCVRVLLEATMNMNATDKEMTECMRLSLNEHSIEELLLEKLSEAFTLKYSHLQLRVEKCYELSPQRTIIMIGYTSKICCNVSGEIWGVRTLLKNEYLLDKEPISVETKQEYNSQVTKIKRDLVGEAIKLHGEELFQNHSNLNIISSSSVRIRRNGNVTKETCVVIYCTTKGAIPLHEDPFPFFLKVGDAKIKTDIREGYFSLCPGNILKTSWNNPLRSGASIGVKGVLQAATMGPFVQLRDGSLGFITCSHLFENVTSGTKTYVVQPSDIEFTDLDITDADRICGYLENQVFDPDRTVSVDAAVVKITRRLPNRGFFALGSKLELKEAGFHEADMPVFDSGSVKTIISCSDAERPVVKFGCKTGLTKGVFRMEGTQVRIKKHADFATPNNQKRAIIRGQYEIQTVGPNDFFQPGDSGSGVYLLDKDKQLHCIGIAIGCTSYRSAIVTPIKEVLKSLGLPVKLKTFKPESIEH